MSTDTPHTTEEGLNMDLPPTDVHHAPVRKAPYYVGMFVLALALLTSALFLYWTFQPADILTITNNPTPVQVVKMDGHEYALTRIQYCKNNDSDGKVVVAFISSSTVIASPPSVGEAQHGCGTRSAPIPVPRQAAADSYHIHFTATYKLNPLRTDVIQWDTQEFKTTGM